MFTPQQLDGFRNRLELRIKRLTSEQISSSEQRDTAILDQQSVGRLSRMDALQQQAMALATNRRRQAEIAKAKAALRALEGDDYGYCTECGEPVGTARLEHDPALTLCISCARGS